MNNISSSLINQMLTLVEDNAQTPGNSGKAIISPEALKKYRETILPLARALNDTAAHPAERSQMLRQLIEAQHALSPGEKSQIAQLAALESRMMRAIQFYERSKRQKTPRQEFTENFKAILKKDGVDLDASVIQEPAQTPHLDAVVKTIPTASIINVITKHPVEWETDVMRQSEWKLYDILKEIMPQLEKEKFNDHIPREKFRAVTQWTQDILNEIRTGEDITYFHKNTVPKENASAATYYANIRQQFSEVADQYNEALQDIMQRPNLPANVHESLAKLHISPERKKTLYSLHSWANFGDGDGRPDSTDIGLYGSVMQGVTQKAGKSEYNGPIIDLRHNAEEQRNLFSSAVQRKYLDSKYKKRGELESFKAMCDRFTGDKKIAPKNGSSREESYNPDYNIFQELKLEDQKEFARKLLTDETPPVQLIEPKVKEQVMDFHPFFYAHYKKFLEDHGLPSTTAFKDLRKISDEEHGDLWGRLHDEVIRETLKREAAGQGKKAFRLNDSGSYSPLFAEDFAAYFHGRKTMDGKGELVTMKEDQRAFDLGIFKRLAIANNFIDTYGTPPDKSEDNQWHSEIFQRYKIANFASEADFYIAMALFKEAGLIDVRDGKVTEAKMGIMPLLETDVDLDNAPKIFGKLLNDPVVKSYWEKRGVAEIMVGYSDGSKSASNAPSQDKIRDTKKKLIALFGEKGIKVHVHEGPGYGLDRGGVLEAGAVMLRQPPELQERGLYDATIQGTLPRDMAGYPEYGKHYLASMLTGIMTGAQHADRQRDPEMAERQKLYDDAREAVFDEAKRNFQTFRKAHQPEIMQLLGAIPKNSDKSSRPESRPDTSQDPYDGTRMIGIEYAMRQIKMPFFEIGLKQALEHFAQSDDLKLPDRNGRMVKGMKALQTLFAEDDMFKLQMNLRQISMSGYRKDIAQEWGKLTSTPEFVKAGCEALDGLAPMLAKIREGQRAERLSGSKHRAGGMQENATIMIDAKTLENSLTGTERLKKERNPYLDYYARAAHMSDTLDIVGQTALLAEAYDPQKKSVIAVKTMNPKNKQKEADRIRMLRNYELCTVAPIETQDLNPLTAEVRKQVEGCAIA